MRAILRSVVVCGAVAAAAVAGGLGAPAQAATSPTVRVTPGLAWPGLPAAVHGTGFRAGQRVALSLDGVMLTGVRATKTGAFSASVRIPTATTPGAHQLVASAGAGTAVRSASTSLRARLQWSQLGLYAGHRSANWSETALSSRTVTDTVPLWTSDFGSPSRGGMVLAQNALIWGTENGAIAIDATTGKHLWTFDLPQEQLIGAAYDADSGLVYLLDPTGHLFALDPRTGAEAWTDTFPGHAGYQGLTLSNGVMYLIAGSNAPATRNQASLTAYDPATRSILWQTPVETGGVTTPVLYNGVLYLAAGQVAAYDASTGAQLWSAPAGDNITLSSLTVSPDGIAASGSDDFVHMYDLNSGAPKWAARPAGENPAQAAFSLVTAEGKVFADFTDNTTAFNASDGSTAWSKPGHSQTALTYANGLIYGGVENSPDQYTGNLTAASADTGEVKASWPASIGSQAATIIADGTLYIPGNQIVADQLPQP